MKTHTIRRGFLFTLAAGLLFAGCASRRSDEERRGDAAEQTAGVPVETVRTDSFSMDFIRFGRGRKTLVILPGLSVQSVMGSAEAVALAYEPFAEEYTVYLFDRRNELPETYTVRDMARDTAEAFRVLGLRDIYLFGASQGGMIAETIASEHPELVCALALGSSAVRVTPEGYRTIEKWIGLAKDGDAEGLYLAFGEAVYPGEVFEQYREILIETAKSVTEEDLSRFVVLAEGVKDFDVTDELEAIRCPVLALESRDDRVLGPEATEQYAELAAGRPGFELFVYEGYGHAAYDTAPDYKDRLARFFAGA